MKYVQKLVVLVAFGLAGLGLIAVARGLGFGALPLALYFSDPTLLRHLYRCHMPGMFGICITAAFMLLLARRPLTGFPLWKRVGITLLLAFAMCTYPASFLQLSVFCGLFTLIVLADHRLRTERAAMVLATGIAVALALIFFYGHYLELFWKFFQGSRGQAVATSGHAPSVAGVLNAWYQSVLLEKYWPFYLPGGIGMVLLIRRARDARWRAFQMAWVLAFVVQIVLTCDYLLPSVRGHIKEMAFLSPLFVLWESEAISWWLARGRTPLRLAAALFVLLLGALSLAKLMEMIRLGFVT